MSRKVKAFLYRFPLLCAGWTSLEDVWGHKLPTHMQELGFNKFLRRPSVEYYRCASSSRRPPSVYAAHLCGCRRACCLQGGIA